MLAVKFLFFYKIFVFWHSVCMVETYKTSNVQYGMCLCKKDLHLANTPWECNAFLCLMYTKTHCHLPVRRLTNKVLGTDGKRWSHRDNILNCNTFLHRSGWKQLPFIGEREENFIWEKMKLTGEGCMGALFCYELNRIPFSGDVSNWESNMCPLYITLSTELLQELWFFFIILACCEILRTALK